MTQIKADAKSQAAPEDAHGLEEKIQDYHRQGGAHGGHGAKIAEGEIASAGITANDDLKKGRPPSIPAKTYVGKTKRIPTQARFEKTDD